jgi:photosystem II 13kDa protein
MMNKSLCLLLVSLLAVITQGFAPQSPRFSASSRTTWSATTTTTTTPTRIVTTTTTTALLAATPTITPSIQFVRGIDEPVVPTVKLTRAKDGSSGIAKFQFVAPNVFDQSIKGDVTGMFMIDDEGELSTSDVNARFTNGKPQAIESTYVMTSPEAWDRFMRFMERYSEANGLGLRKA